MFWRSEKSLLSQIKKLDVPGQELGSGSHEPQYGDKSQGTLMYIRLFCLIN